MPISLKEEETHKGRRHSDKGHRGGGPHLSAEAYHRGPAVPEGGGEARNRSSLSALSRSQPCQCLDLGLPASRAVRWKLPSLWCFVTEALVD